MTYDRVFPWQLPEGSYHPDNGCPGVSECTSALNCPLAVCPLDADTNQLAGEQAQRDTRNEEIVRLHHLGVAASAIAAQVGVSRQWVYKTLDRRGLR